MSRNVLRWFSLLIAEEVLRIFVLPIMAVLEVYFYGLMGFRWDIYIYSNMGDLAFVFIQ